MKEAIFSTDPFYAECRAYGTIKGGKVDRHAKSPRIRHQIAVKCYGYLFLSTRDERWLIEQGHDLEADILDSEMLEALDGDTRVRAIVKHLEEGPKSLHAGNIRRAWRNVHILNSSLKIYNRAIQADNFIGPRIVSFSSSWTESHPILQYLEKEGKAIARAMKVTDKQNFQDMIEEEEIPTRLRVVPISRHQLRSRGEPAWAGKPLPKRHRRTAPNLD
jgi:hypothetical protein